MFLKRRTGKQVDRASGRIIDVELEVDDVYVVDDKGKKYRVAWADRRPGANLVQLGSMSEAEIALAKKLLANRDCDNGKPDSRNVSEPPKFPEPDNE